MSLISCGQRANAYDFSCDFFVRQEDYIPFNIYGSLLEFEFMPLS